MFSHELQKVIIMMDGADVYAYVIGNWEIPVFHVTQPTTLLSVLMTEWISYGF